MRRMVVALGAGLALLAVVAGPSVAQEAWPSRSIRMVVPFPPGGGTDALARAIVERMQKSLGQTIVIDNRGGAGSNLGHEIVAKTPPDGYTILVSGGNLPLFPFVVAKLGYDPATAFAPIGFIAKQESILVGSANAPFKDLKAIMDAARGSGGVQFGTAGVTTPMHLAGEQFGILNKLKLTHVPFKGTGPLVADLLGGHIDIGVSSLNSIQAHLVAGKAKPYAIASQARSHLVPDVPTFKELGAGDVEGAIIYTLLAPAGTPPATMAKLNAALNAAVATPDARADLEKRGFVAMGGTPEALGTWLAEQAPVWGPVMRAAGIKPE